MTVKNTRYIMVVLLFIFMTVSIFPNQAFAGDYGNTVLKYGSTGSAVVSLQQDLTALGYNTYGIDGIFGWNTQNAVVNFQKAKGIAVDGKVGTQTKTTLHTVQVPTPSRGEARQPEMADWWTVVNGAFARGAVATVTDIDTGITFNVKRLGGSSHADCEPLTTEDAAKMKKARGGEWSWNRRAILVNVNGRLFAASQNGMPHGGQSITSNNFNGHFCIHFLNSKTHGSNRVDEAHQAAVKKAAQYKL